jgi:hypothetical protein
VKLKLTDSDWEVISRETKSSDSHFERSKLKKMAIAYLNKAIKIFEMKMTGSQNMNIPPEPFWIEAILKSDPFLSPKLLKRTLVPDKITRGNLDFKRVPIGSLVAVIDARLGNLTMTIIL